MTPAIKDTRGWASIELGRGYFEMAFIFRYYVKNTPAAVVCAVICRLYFMGMNYLAQKVHNIFLRPLVAQHEWNLLVAYGRKHKII